MPVSFLSSIASAAGVTMVTESGDKTFFVCALLAARGSKLKVFCGAYLALVVQTVACVLVAELFANRARSIAYRRYRWDLIIGGAALLVFGVLGIWEGLRKPPVPNEQELEDDQEMDNLDDFIAGLDADKRKTSRLSQILEHVQHNQDALLKLETLADDVYTDLETANPCSDHGSHGSPDHHGLDKTAYRPREELQDPLTGRRFSAYSQSLKTLNDAATLIHNTGADGRIMLKAFSAVFAAELGDRSMFSTIALAATENVWGVTIGVLIGHFCVNLAGVCCASLICRYVSERTTTLFGGFLFTVFGLVSLYEALQVYLTAP
ncbi:putative membrane protein [Gregarina niphandrodes]|uniref:GDT1 family protein n=1 Tax=Gregarina niphandrodes TaxID=110365 RepID=A0A023B3X1_GRENI|nr:putative membrane protein [Gregarina niphandrodes]EZG55994.1 putative membrane protein [Gregarina niphandrodes]|eukprot:XP_011131382.1 putative membrane protein [Gregarina niphandrodes]